MIFLLFFALSSSARAATTPSLLTPASGIATKNYFALCRKPGYLCTTDFFFKNISAAPTPLFDQLLRDLNRSSAVYRHTFLRQLVPLLETEMLSRPQLRLLLDLLQEFPETRDSPLTKKLIYLHGFLADSTPSEEEQFAVFFKQKLSFATLKKIYSQNIKLPLYILRYNHLPAKISATTNTWSESAPLAVATCAEFKANLKPHVKHSYLRTKCLGRIQKEPSRAVQERTFYRRDLL